MGIGKTSFTVDNVKLADTGGIFFCLDKTCGKNNIGWDGFVPFESFIMIQEHVEPKKFEDKKESIY
jgi:thioredoxin-related protein